MPDQSSISGMEQAGLANCGGESQFPRSFARERKVEPRRVCAPADLARSDEAT